MRSAFTRLVALVTVQSRQVTMYIPLAAILIVNGLRHVRDPLARCMAPLGLLGLFAVAAYLTLKFL